MLKELSILYVEDEEDIREELIEFLELRVKKVGGKLMALNIKNGAEFKIELDKS